uniref:Uncharacterized protein n=1 Tax=Manihot esculenta TaxID=3983 RepID=A0A2C9VTW5_MANES
MRIKCDCVGSRITQLIESVISGWILWLKGYRSQMNMSLRD